MEKITGLESTDLGAAYPCCGGRARFSMATCPTHPSVTLRCPACIGSRGGAATSPAKRRAARKNGKQPKRPRQEG